MAPVPRTYGASHRQRRLMESKWEREVQSGIRGLTPPVPDREILLIGRDGDGIGVVSWSCLIGPALWKCLCGLAGLSPETPSHRGRDHGRDAPGDREPDGRCPHR